MFKTFRLVSLGIIPVLLQSCSLFSSENNTTASVPPNPITSNQNSVPNAPTNNNQGTVKKPLVNTINYSGLIASTNSQQRIRQVSQGRPNPFASLSVVPTIKAISVETNNSQKIKSTSNLKLTTETSQTTKSLLSNSPKGNTIQTTLVSQPLTAKLPNIKISTKTNHSSQKIITAKANLKNHQALAKKPMVVIPQPTQAENTVIAGVIDIDGTVKAIIQAPEEKSSRYIAEGQYIANGKVLVKRIDSYSSTPIVVLEQYGQEVIKEVGEVAKANNSDKNSPTTSTMSGSMIVDLKKSSPNQ